MTPWDYSDRYFLRQIVEMFPQTDSREEWRGKKDYERFPSFFDLSNNLDKDKSLIYQTILALLIDLDTTYSHPVYLTYGESKTFSHCCCRET